MPTYEYRCRDCGHTFDVVQAMRDETLTVCPICGGELRKVFAPPAISFKGSGFYATDHGKKKSKTTSEKTGEKADEKPAASTDSSDNTGEKKDRKESSKPAEKTSVSSSTTSGSGGSGSMGSTDGKNDS